jgi:exopolysaccharide production protein ExoY
VRLTAGTFLPSDLPADALLWRLSFEGKVRGLAPTWDASHGPVVAVVERQGANMSLSAFVREAAHLPWGGGDSREKGLVAKVDRGLNFVSALVILVLLSPLFIAVALLIWRHDGRPLMFGHYRVGAGGRLFRCWKFRTMVRDAEHALAAHLEANPAAREEWARDHKLAHDPRITPIGRLLRRTSLDELPQLFNVLAGDMNLVGPRPITVTELTRYGIVRWHYLSVRPGMTGLWQVSGRNDVSYEQRVALDRQYVEQRSIWNDVVILVKTVGVVAGSKGAR